MNNYSKYRIPEFAKEMIQKYNKRTYLTEITNRRFFDEGRDVDDDFVQIGERYSEMQGEWFDPDANTWISENIPHQLVSNLIRGEINYVIKKLDEYKEENDFEQEKIESFDYDNLDQILNEFLGKTHLIIPDEYGREFINWSLKEEYNVEDVDKTGSRIFELKNNTKAVIAGQESNLDNIILVNREELTLIQKRKEDKPAEQEGISPISKYQNLGEKEPLMLYFGEKDNRKDVDFLFRTVIKLKKPEAHAISFIEIEEN